MRDLATGRRLGLIEQQRMIAQWRQQKAKEDEFVAAEMEKFEKAGGGVGDAGRAKRKL